MTRSPESLPFAGPDPELITKQPQFNFNKATTRGEVKLNTRVSTPEEDRDGATEVGTKLKLRVLGNFESRSDH